MFDNLLIGKQIVCYHREPYGPFPDQQVAISGYRNPHISVRILGFLTFEEAGWIYEGYFHDEPTKFYEMGVAIAP